ncbi:fibrocystin-L, partial [Brachionus plicatilis]
VRTLDLNYESAVRIESFGAGERELGKIGLVWSNYIGTSNMAPYKPWAGIKHYQSIDGTTLFENLTITNFNAQCGARNYFLATNKYNDDGQHPVMIKNVRMFGVDNSSKVWIHRPNLDKINIWDCIDMDCDALKKALLNDLDGSFLGERGTVIPQSEFEWGSQKRGLGDFRIPKEMLAAPNGSMIPPSQVYKQPGIVRDDDMCEYIGDWQAYKCHGIEHRILIIESMDADTLKRRLSPVAILVNNTYLDLINGPQDHGCCFGYTCLERLSTFMAIVSSNTNIDIYLTSLPPNQLRFRILNADADYKVRLSMHYFTSNRIDLYKNDRFVPPTNAHYLNGNMQLNDTTENLAKYMPHYSDPSGTNLAVREESKVYFTIGGGDYLDLKVTPTIFVRFGVPAITESSFFNKETLVQNFADLLGIPQSKIRRVQIIAESPDLRKRRSSESIYIALTLMENPIDSLSHQDQDNTIKNELNNLTSSIISEFTTGILQKRAEQMLNISLTSLSVQKPNANGTDATINRLSGIVIEREADLCKEMVPCEVQPILKILDENECFK